MKRIIGIAVGAFTLAVSSVFVLSSAPVSAVGSSALSIAPKKNYVVTPGDTIEDTLRITNVDNTRPLSLQLSVIDFTYTDDTGTPKLIVDQDIPMKTWSLKPYIEVPESVTIQPGESETVDISLLMPEEQGAGSYYSAILYSTGSTSDGGNVGLSASGTTLVFATVPGEVNQDLTLKNFGAYFGKSPDSDGYSKVSMQKPKEIAYTLENKGNVAESPVGSIIYKHMFGQEKKITDVNPNGSLALIGQSRTFVSCIELKELEEDDNSRARVCEDKFMWPGLYTMHLDLYYGQNGNNTREVVGSSYFWYLPWWFLVPVLLIVAIIIIFTWKFVAKVRGAMYGPKTTAKRRK